MALKRSITQKVYDTLSDEIKALYQESKTAGTYQLDLDRDDDDASELKRAKDREVAARKDAETRARELEAKLEELTGIDAKKRGDIETLEKSWKDKLEKVVSEKNAELERKNTFIKTTLIDSVASQLATKLCGDKATIILPHIKARLAADVDAEQPTTKVLDAAGKISAASIADLEKEFVANKDFGAIIVASKASGSGAPAAQLQTGQGGASLDAQGKPKSFTELTVKEKIGYINAKKQSSED